MRPPARSTSLGKAAARFRVDESMAASSDCNSRSLPSSCSLRTVIWSLPYCTDRGFYALALLASASPADKTHRKQKEAADILEPLFREFPQHPGIPHYLIHAYDNAELAQRGLLAARAYSRVAPSAPHALHMPSHT
jgi:hypothetical protein